MPNLTWQRFRFVTGALKVSWELGVLGMPEILTPWS